MNLPTRNKERTKTWKKKISKREENKMEWKKQAGYTSSERYKQPDEINIDLWKQFLIWKKEMSINKTNTYVRIIEEKI